LSYTQEDTVGYFWLVFAEPPDKGVRFMRQKALINACINTDHLLHLGNDAKNGVKWGDFLPLHA